MGTVKDNDVRRRILRRILREARGCVKEHVGSDRWTHAATQVLPPGKQKFAPVLFQLMLRWRRTFWRRMEEVEVEKEDGKGVGGVGGERERWRRVDE